MLLLSGLDGTAAIASAAGQPGLTPQQRAFAAAKRWVRLTSALRCWGSCAAADSSHFDCSASILSTKAARGQWMSTAHCISESLPHAYSCQTEHVLPDFDTQDTQDNSERLLSIALQEEGWPAGGLGAFLCHDRGRALLLPPAAAAGGLPHCRLCQGDAASGAWARVQQLHMQAQTHGTDLSTLTSPSCI